MTQRSQREYFDELIQRTQTYRRSEEFFESLKVVAALQAFSPFNAYLLKIQRPLLRFAAPKEQWEKQFHRTVRTDVPAHPLVILWPFGPVTFVYDYADTVGEPLPQAVLEPFRSQGYITTKEWERLFRNCRRRGIVIKYMSADPASAGWIELWEDQPQAVPSNEDAKDKAKREEPPVRFQVMLNGNQDKTVQYATLLHELGHLACGHLGASPSDDWPSRKIDSEIVREFEAETVSYIVCNRLGIRTNSEAYLADYVRHHMYIPDEVSTYTIMTASGLIEEWTRKLGWPRKPRKAAAELRLQAAREQQLREVGL
ncbi:hypothetical protein ACFSR9_01290 [Deinococcus taklimakanensis]|uniref:IrrE N-terminal-like domain-containing protein n=1 Tax=Deinococcus taklimakanensis TaxID=536443 RepID=A0ABW5P0Q3_9DEIO